MDIQFKPKQAFRAKWLPLAAFCLLFLILGIAACGEPPKENPDGGGKGDLAGDIVPAPPCIGKVIVEKNERGQIVIGKLVCAGVCPDETPCKPVQNKGKDKTFCGCPGDAQPPEGCSTLHIKARDGKIRVACGGVCPIPTDICMPIKQVLEPNKKWAISCDCISLVQVPKITDTGRPDVEEKEEREKGQ